MASAAQMYELQKIDTMADKVRQRLLQIKQLMDEPAELKAARSQAQATEANLHEWHARQKDAELEAQTLKQRIADTDNRLMSGKVTNPKELEALQASAEALRRQHTAIEDKGVEALLMVEDLTTQLAQARAALNEMEAQWTQRQSALEAEDTKMKRNFVILRKKRENAVAALGADALSEYERLRKRKAGIAVARVENNICDACHVQIPTGIAANARSGRDLVLCPSCGRVLFGG